MANGNGTTDQYDASPMSKHVRPTLAWAGFFVYCMTLFATLPVALADKEWGLVGLLIAPPIAFALWYVNVRSGDKMFDKFSTMQGTAIKNALAAFKTESPKADSGQSTAGAGGQTAVGNVPFRDDWGSSGGLPAPQPVNTNPQRIGMQVGAMQFELDVVTGKETFDPVLFMEDVRADCLAQEKDPKSPKASLFYDARAEIEGNAAPWKFTSVATLKEAVNFVFGLARDAFIEKVGVDYSTAVTNFAQTGISGCSTCAKTICTHPTIEEEFDYLGVDYTRMLQEYRELQFAANFIQ